MAINVYGKKELEDKESVIYKAGSDYEEPTGKIKFDKETLELSILKSEEGSLSDRGLFKIASKIKKIYKETGEFPSKVESAS